MRTAIALAAAVLVAAVAAPAAAQPAPLTTPTWTSAVQQPPADATGTLDEAGGVSCRTANWCVSIGQYASPSGSSAFLATGPAAGTPTVVAAPVPSGGSGPTVLNDVACAAGRPCVAVGSYGPDGDRRPLVETQQHDGTWRASSIAGLVASTLDTVACNATTCLTGGMTGFDDNPQLAVRHVGSAWLPVQVSTAGPTVRTIDDVACSTTTCFAQGSINGGAGRAVFIYPSGDGYKATNYPLPDGIRFVGLNRMACWTGANCVAVGSYGTFPHQHAVVETLADGVLSEQTLALPVSAQKQPISPGTVSCTSTGQCASFVLHGYGDPTQGYFDNGTVLLTRSSAGVWRARLAPAPQHDVRGDFVVSARDVACNAGGSCVVVAGSNVQPSRTIVETLSAGRWRPRVVPNPAELTARFPDGDVASGLRHVSCAGSACVAVGNYVVSSGGSTLERGQLRDATTELS